LISFALTIDETLLLTGRIPLAELQSALYVDLSFIEERAASLIRTHKDLTLLGGELFEEYVWAQ
jgi:hypothetical protein